MMTTSRAESQQPYGRRRSNTAQSILRAAPVAPLSYGDSKILNSWVHDTKESTSVMFNQSWWPGVSEGDLLSVRGSNSEYPDAFLFTVARDDGYAKPQLQISIRKPIAEAFRLRNNSEVIVTKVREESCAAEYVEFVFQDQYLGRNDMWRLGERLVGQCVYSNQDITFIGNIAAKIQNIYISGNKVSSALMTHATKAIYRSLSAKVTIFIQVCHELWKFAGDGERYNEKIVHSFLPTLFAKWRDSGTNHIVTIVFISRVFYDEADVDYAAGPMRRDNYGRWYKDFFKVVTDLEVIYDWKPTLVSLKTSFWDFQRDILLTHHYHQANQDSAIGPPTQVRLIGRISFAHDGPILEALNLALNPTETHYIDRSLSLTGSMIILITPGTGYFRVSKHLLRLTTTRLLDQGFGLDMVSLAKKPLHQSPIFSFQGTDPEFKIDTEGKSGPHSMDPLWGSVDDEDPSDSSSKKIFWWEPFWVSISFWETQLHLPFREDRFVGRAKMHQIQMLGLLDFDVASSIEVPFLHESTEYSPACSTEDIPISKAEAEKFDVDVFAPKAGPQIFNPNRSSVASLGGLTIRSNERRNSHRNSVIASKIAPIEESPKRVIADLPPEAFTSTLAIPMFSGLSTSPSQSSIHSLRSTISSKATRDTSARGTLAKLAPSWLFSSFRSGPSEPQTSQVSASSTPSTPSTPTPTRTNPLPQVPTSQTSTPSKPSVAPQVGRSPMPMAIKGATQVMNRSSVIRTFDDDGLASQRGSYIRHSPLNSPPREEANFGKRRSTTSITTQFSSPFSAIVCNPSQPQYFVPTSQSSLARRWQHMYPQPLYKHAVKWKAMAVPVCLPLTVEHFPSASELETSYDVFSYDFVVDPHEMFSFLVKPPTGIDNIDRLRREWALVVMRGMAAVRLAQGFQFVLRAPTGTTTEKRGLRRTKSFLKEEDLTPKPIGPTDVLRSTADPVYLSMTNEIHQISYTGEAIQVRRYVRRMPPLRSFEYQCLMWPKLGGGYTELSTTFAPHGLENYGWNRLDMLVAGYEHNFNESLRYWRTRFIVIPTAEPPTSTIGPSGEKLNDEEMRILGIEKLSDQFTKLRWQPAEDRTNHPAPPVRLLQTTLGPAMSVLDASLMDQLEQLNAAALRKKMKSEREIGEMTLAAIAKAMREDDGVSIKNYQWHHSQYANSFIGYDFVSWLVREFRDVSTRLQGVEWGVKLLEQGLFEHCRGQHNFLDGHYYYRLKGEYTVPMTPKGWFSRRSTVDELNPRYSSGRAKGLSPRRMKKRLIVSQSMVIDIDPNKKSDQAEAVVLHHDIIHNPTTCFHFELQWIGTTPRCIEDLIRQWSRLIERHGLKLVEAYVTQISDIRDRNAFQSCFPIRLAVPPPVIPDLDKVVPEGTQTTQYFEYTLLRHFGYVLDVEAASMYPEQIEVIYSYRRSPYKYSQFVHHSGAGFVQVLGGSQGFLFLTNRLMGPGRMGTMKTKDYRPGAMAEEIRQDLHRFCSDKEALTKFWDDELEKLGHPTEEPPPLSI